MSHSQWKCVKCGVGAHSKCPSRRSVFIADQYVGMLSNLVTVTPPEEGRHNHTITFSLSLDYEGTEHKAAPLVAVKEAVSDFTDEQLAQATCDHEWQIQEGECLFGCHKAK